MGFDEYLEILNKKLDSNLPLRKFSPEFTDINNEEDDTFCFNRRKSKVIDKYGTESIVKNEDDDDDQN